MEIALVLIAVATGLYMAWNIGANDVANAMGTSVGSGALTLKRAIIVAAVFEFSGAVLVGGSVSETIRKGILDPTMFGAGTFGGNGPLILAIGMTAALLAAALWLQLATAFGLPVSTTHSIVGAVVGFGLVSVGASGVDWPALSKIVASWFVSPVLGGLLGFLTFMVVKRLVLDHADPIKATIAVAPWLVGVVGFILALTTVYKGLSKVLDDPNTITVMLASAGIGGICVITARLLINERRIPVGGDPAAYVEKVFAFLQIVTAGFVAFAHGANDVANAVGPLATVVSIAKAGFTEVPLSIPVPTWILAVGGLGIVIGLATWGYRVIETIGHHITELTPTRGFAAEFGAACTVLIASVLGLPVSTTHVLVGGVIGVGLAMGMAALNFRTLRNIVASWLATVPAAGVLSALIFLGLRAIFVAG